MNFLRLVGPLNSQLMQLRGGSSAYMCASLYSQDGIPQSYRSYADGWLAGGVPWLRRHSKSNFCSACCRKSTPSYHVHCSNLWRRFAYSAILPLLGKHALIVANCTVCKCVASGNTSNGNVRPQWPYLLRSIAVRWSVSRAPLQRSHIAVANAPS